MPSKNNSLLKRSIFNQLSKDEEEFLFSVSKQIKFATGDIIVKGKKDNKKIFILQDGEIEVIKRSRYATECLSIASHFPGVLIGESTILGKIIRRINFRAKKDCTVLVIDMRLVKKNKTLYKKIKAFFKNKSTKLLQTNNKNIIADIREAITVPQSKASLGALSLTMIGIASIYTITLPHVDIIIRYFKHVSFVSFMFVLVFNLIGILTIKCFRYPLHQLGFNLVNYRKNILEGLLLGTAIVVVLILSKWLCITFNLFNYGQKFLFDFSWINPYFNGSYTMYFAAFILYFISVPLQEIFIRGTLQGTFAAFLGPSYGGSIFAIVVSNLFYAAAHTHTKDNILILCSFILGISLGFLYARQKSLVGVIVAHLLAGSVSLFIFGF